MPLQLAPSQRASTSTCSLPPLAVVMSATLCTAVGLDASTVIVEVPAWAPWLVGQITLNSCRVGVLVVARKRATLAFRAGEGLCQLLQILHGEAFLEDMGVGLA